MQTPFPSQPTSPSLDTYSASPSDENTPPFSETLEFEEYPLKNLIDAMSQPSVSFLDAWTNILQSHRTVENVVKWMMQQSNPASERIVALETLRCMSIEEQEVCRQSIIDFMKAPHLLPCSGGRYHSAPLLTALRLLSEEQLKSLPLAPEIKRDLARILLWTNNLGPRWSFLPRLKELALYPEDIIGLPAFLEDRARSLRLLKWLVPQLDPALIQELFPLVQAQSGCLGPFIYALSDDQWSSTEINNFLTSYTEPLCEQGLNSLLLLSDTPSCHKRLEQVIKRLMQQRSITLETIAPTTQLMRQLEGSSESGSIQQLWNKLIQWKGALLPLMIIEKMAQPYLEPWQWMDFFQQHAWSIGQTAYLNESIWNLYEEKIQLKATQNVLIGRLAIEPPENKTKTLSLWWKSLPKYSPSLKYQIMLGVILSGAHPFHSSSYYMDSWAELIANCGDAKAAFYSIIQHVNAGNSPKASSIQIIQLSAGALENCSLFTAIELLANNHTEQASLAFPTSVLLLSHRGTGIALLQLCKTDPSFWMPLYIYKQTTPQQYPALVKEILANFSPSPDSYLIGLETLEYFPSIQPFFQKMSDKQFTYFLRQVKSEIESVEKEIQNQIDADQTTNFNCLPLWLINLFQALTLPQTKKCLDDLSQTLLLALTLYLIDLNAVQSHLDAQKLIMLSQRLQTHALAPASICALIQQITPFDLPAATELAARYMKGLPDFSDSSVSRKTIKAIADEEYRNKILYQEVDSTTRLLIPSIAAWLSPDQLYDQCGRLGLRPFVEIRKNLTECQQKVLVTYLKEQAQISFSFTQFQRQELLMLSQALQVPLSLTHRPTTTKIMESNSNLISASVPLRYRTSPAANLGQIRGEQGAAHLEVLCNIAQHVDVTEEDLMEMNLDWISLHAILLHEVRDVFEQYSTERDIEQYKQTLEEKLIQWLKSNSLLNRDVFIQYINKESKI